MTQAVLRQLRGEGIDLVVSRELGGDVLATRFHVAVVCLPFVERGRADVSLPANIQDRPPGLGFFQHLDDLCFRESRSPHRPLLGRVCQKSQPFADAILGEGYRKINMKKRQKTRSPGPGQRSN